MSDDDTINIVIIDDNKYMRMGVKEILADAKDIHICDEAENMNRAAEVLAACLPDVALIDISLECSEGGLQLIRDTNKLNLSMKYIVLSAYDESLYAARSLEEGAMGYICKDKVVQCLIPAIRCVYRGNQYVSSDIDKQAGDGLWISS